MTEFRSAPLARQALAFVLVIVAAALMPAPLRSAGIAPEAA